MEWLEFSWSKGPLRVRILLALVEFLLSRLRRLAPRWHILGSVGALQMRQPDDPFTEGSHCPSFTIIAIITRTSEFGDAMHGRRINRFSRRLYACWARMWFQ
jgi:hypothetical protein